MNKGINVLSLFDGMSCGQIALERAGIEVSKYYASEIDKYAMTVANKNFPDTIQMGDVTKWEDWDIDWSSIDLLIGGSPCQSISTLGDGSGLEGKSGLFFTYLSIKEKLYQENPNAKFLLENVAGKKDAIAKMDELLEVKHVDINSNKFSAQNRSRKYWTDIDILPIQEKDIKLIDILEEGVPEDAILSEGRLRWLLSDKGQKTLAKRYCSLDPERASCLTARSDASWNSNYVTRDGIITKLTPIEYERLQTVPDNYTSCVSNSQRYKMLGNCWTVDVISHILSQLPLREI